MLFNSQLFLLGFLPLAVAFFRLVPDREPVRLWYLVGISLVFYGYWDVSFVPLLVFSVLLNWSLVKTYERTRLRAFLAITLDLGILNYCKYATFLVANFNAPAGTYFTVDRVQLPLGISFFTFHNVMYIVHLLNRRAPIYRLRDYALYIMLFPQIVAGPLVRHWELIPQIPRDPREGPVARRIEVMIAARNYIQ